MEMLKPYSLNTDLFRIEDDLIIDDGWDIEKMRIYSRMKYGEVEATNYIAKKLFNKIISSPKFQDLVETENEIFVSSAAYGSVPTASHAIMESLVKAFSDTGICVNTFKICREGDFHLANYGALGISGRKKSLSSRKIFLHEDIVDLIANKTLLIVDDLRATGMHELSLVNLLEKYTDRTKILFAYPVSFGENISRDNPSFESIINRAEVKTIRDLLNVATNSKFPLIINSRMIKFILENGAGDKAALMAFFDFMGMDYCQKLYFAAIGSDGYSKFEIYGKVFNILKRKISAANDIMS